MGVFVSRMRDMMETDQVISLCVLCLSDDHLQASFITAIGGVWLCRICVQELGTPVGAVELAALAQAAGSGDIAPDCSICYERLTLEAHPVQLPCRHVFCRDCVAEW